MNGYGNAPPEFELHMKPSSEAVTQPVCILVSSRPHGLSASGAVQVKVPEYVVANPETMETDGDDDASGQVKTAMLAAPVTEPKYIVEAAPLTGAIANAEDVR